MFLYIFSRDGGSREDCNIFYATYLVAGKEITQEILDTIPGATTEKDPLRRRPDTIMVRPDEDDDGFDIFEAAEKVANALRPTVPITVVTPRFVIEQER